jgi:hypothetical protein
LIQKSLKRVTWEERGPSVLIPSWSAFVSEYSSLLEGFTIGNLPESLGRVPQIAPRIRDRKGMLLTAPQRVERARQLLSTAVALALIGNGWKLHSRPGEFHLEKNTDQLNPYQLIAELSNGTISNDSWITKCKELGIDSIPLSVAPEKAGAASQKASPLTEPTPRQSVEAPPLPQ